MTRLRAAIQLEFYEGDLTAVEPAVLLGYIMFTTRHLFPVVAPALLSLAGSRLVLFSICLKQCFGSLFNFYGPGSVFIKRVWIQKAVEYGSGSETLVEILLNSQLEE